jgi:DNA-binding Xre family transcriptional regulator
MKRKMGYRWHLRRLMADRGMFSTTDLVPRLAERGVVLSREQVYRLAAQTPERLNLAVFAALCDILDCTPTDLFEPFVEQRSVRKPAAEAGRTRSRPAADARPRPTRARILPQDSSQGPSTAPPGDRDR